MKIVKPLFLAFFSIIFFLIPAKVNANETKPKLYFFFSPGCPHCAAEEEEILQPLEAQEKVEIIRYDISKEEGRKVLQNLGQAYGLDISGTPRTFVGETFIRGYLNYETHGVVIAKAVDECLQSECPDIVAPILGQYELETREKQAKLSPVLDNIKLPLVGTINPKAMSLPALTFIIALLDGFNPCAMWTLVFLISLLLGLKSKKRRWILGMAFITASGLVYFLFLTAWLNTFLFLGFVRWLQVGIGVFALAAAIWSIRDFWVNKDGGCSTEDSGKKQKMFHKLKQIVRKDNLWLALGGIVGLALAVNLVELLCSAGLPAIYTQILSLSSLPTWKYYAYLVFYVVVFVIDDLVVFILAMKTAELVGIEGKYARWSRLIGGIIMLAIGILLVLKPEVLMLG
ncbi:MAG: hypothetical protein ABH814_00725 [bacterium]